MENTTRIYCHRGLCVEKAEENTLVAIERAFLKGFDVEIDIRLDKGKLATGHDEAQKFDWDALFKLKNKKRIAFHVKEATLGNKLHSLLSYYKYKDYLIFGFSENELQNYIDLFGVPKLAVECYSGSELEKVIKDIRPNIWAADLDDDKPLWINPLVTMARNKNLYLVSPECFDGSAISMLDTASIYGRHELSGICTDSSAFYEYFKFKDEK